MTTTLTRPDAGVINLTEDSVEPGDAESAHIVKTKPGEVAVAVVMEARVYGYQVEALCGYVFIPQQDPKQLPVCTKCKEIYELNRIYSEDLKDVPDS